MASLHLLPCSNCDHKFRIETRDAGRQLECPDCKTEIVVPRLGDIRKLELLEQEVERKSPRGSKSNAPVSRGRAVMFTIGLALAVLFGIAGGALYFYSSTKKVNINLGETNVMAEGAIEEMPAPELYDFFQLTMKDKPLGAWKEDIVMANNKEAAILDKFAYVLFSVAGLGLLMMLGSLLFGKSR